MTERQQMQKRILTLFCVSLGICSLLMMRLYHLCMDESLLQSAQRQSSYFLDVTDTRGKIYDRNGELLTDIEEKNRIAVVPTREAAQACADQIEGADRRRVLDRIREGKPFLYDLPKQEKVYAQDVENFPVTNRLAHDSADRYAVHLIGYRDGEGKGVCGLEKSFDEEFSAAGEEVQVRCQVDAMGNAMHSDGMQIRGNPHSGKSGIVLTLDRRMQKIVEEVGEEQIEKGAIVVMKPQSGEIVACASFPQYDPYDLEKALQDENRSLLNRALMPYCVGSSFKLVTTAAALEQGISPSFSINCVGATQVAGRTFYCHNRAGHRETDLKSAIEHSCNPYFIALGQEVGGKAILGMAQAMGFGEETVLAPGIIAEKGTLPTLSDLASPHELANFSFGQGKLTATPIQVAAMVSAVCNDGLLPTPTLLLGKTEDGKGIEKFLPTATRRVFSKQTAAFLKDAMIGVVEEGSAPMAKPKEGGAGGKTASAQTGIIDESGEEIVHAWFAGFFPAQTPQYAAVVLVEGGEYGGRVASPIFKEIADGWRKYE